MKIPVIDFKSYDESRPETLSSLAGQIDDALSGLGFIAVTNIGIEPDKLEHVFNTSKAFFAMADENKRRSAYTSAEDNFGFQGMMQEHLNPARPADLKETFTMRCPFKYEASDQRWPSSEFRETVLDMYNTSMNCAFKVLRVFSAALEVERDFFVQYHTGENVTLRLLHYPSAGVDAVSPEQLGAGAHTDYGVITLLFQDDVGGLEVLDKNGVWQAVDYIENAIVINTGDLMERWTNGRYKSTRHRVQPRIGQRDRYSIAMFIDPDTATQVTVLDSCVSTDNPARFPAITAGEHILAKIRATHGNY